MEMKDKLISFPKEVLDALEEYKKRTGIPASHYIRNATIRSMIVDGLIFFKTKYIYIEDPGNGEKIKQAIPEEIKFCDGDKCMIDPIMVHKKC